MRDPARSITAADLDPAIYAANIAALRSVDPALADTIDSTQVPTGSRPARARDGRVSFVWDEPEGLRWLGGTCVPAARAAGLIDNFQAGSGNCLFVGLAAGTEAAELLARLPKSSALYVIESDAAATTLVLHVVDLSAAIAARRLILILDQDPWAVLRSFLRNNPGFLAPQRVLAWPWLTRDEHQEIATRINALAAEITAERDESAARLRSKLRPPSASAGTIIAIVSLSDDPRTTHVASGIQWGARQLGLEARTFCADSPERKHPLALAQFLANPEIGKIILLDSIAADFGDLLPAQLPNIVWLTPHALVTPGMAGRIAHHDAIVVSTPAQRNALAAEHETRQVIFAPPAARPTPTNRVRMLLVLAPDGDDRAEYVGLHLASHVALWNEVRRIVTSRSETYWDDETNADFLRAEAASGVRISEPTVRQGVLDRVQSSLAPAIVRNTFTSVLRSTDIEFDLATPAIPPPHATAYAAVFHLSLDGEPTCEFLDAIANGARPLVRARHGRIPPGIAPILPSNCVTPVASAAELIAQVRRLAGAGPDPVSREHVLAHHTWRERIRDVLKKTG